MANRLTILCLAIAVAGVLVFSYCAQATVSDRGPERTGDPQERAVQKPRAQDAPAVERTDAAPEQGAARKLADTASHLFGDKEECSETLAEHLQRIIAGRVDPVRKRSNLEVRNVAKSRLYNPDGKQLDAGGEAELQRILDQYNERDFKLYLNHRHLADQALLRAIDLGQIETRPVTPIGPGMSQSMAKRANEQSRQEVLVGLRARLGRELEDWGWRQFATYQPGKGQANSVVYYTRAQAPELFANRERRRVLRREIIETLRNFFAAHD